MKSSLYSINGEKKKDIELPAIFDTTIREDLVKRLVEVEKRPQLYGLFDEAGKRHSASGILSHKRHDWKGQYGKGISRVPRKIMWRRGVQFNWVGAEVSGTRGGRRPHGPKAIRAQIKMNKKEMNLALASAIAATAKAQYVSRRYARASEKIHVPVAIEGKFDKLKMKDFRGFIDKVWGNEAVLALRQKSIRAGKGKVRGRTYKSNAGVLVVTGDEETFSLKGVETRTISQLCANDLYPLGRLTIYTEKAMEALTGWN